MRSRVRNADVFFWNIMPVKSLSPSTLVGRGVRIIILITGIHTTQYTRGTFPAMRRIVEYIDYTTIGKGVAFLVFVGLGLIS